MINHGVVDSVVKNMMDACERFFNLAEEEKKGFQTRGVLDPIKYGTSFNVAIDKVFLWRDYVKVIAHPQFHSLTKPIEYRY